MEAKKSIVIRVYGFILNDKDEILIAEEYHYNSFMRKFPGGGLEPGEGVQDGLRRELREELNLEVEIGAHVHTTPDFIESVFNKQLQVIGIYYQVSTIDNIDSLYRELYEMPNENGIEKFKWVPLEELKPSDLTFPMDQQAFMSLLKSRR